MKNETIGLCLLLMLLSLELRLRAQDVDRELESLLAQSARYCERLKKAALKFNCQEKVTENFIANDRIGKSRTWVYDYRIVLKDGKLDEMRFDGKARRKKGQTAEKKELETVYKSFYSFYLPATFLSAERQTEYRYTRVSKKKAWTTGLRIVAQPIKPQTGLPGGELWIDEQDGSVILIKLDPYTVNDFLDRLDPENKKEKCATITDYHSYKKRYNGLRFPSQIQIVEQRQYKNSALAAHGAYASIFGPAFYQIKFVYEKYKFFDVQTDEQATGCLP